MNISDTKLNIRIDKKTKQKAKSVLEALGLDLSSGVKLFFHSVINTQSIPFPFRTKNGYTLAQEERMISETQHALKDYKLGEKTGYDSAEDLHKVILG
jgi:addiction module RelB/DinJ family antitoxin